MTEHEMRELRDEVPAMNMLDSIYADSRAGGWVRGDPNACGCGGSGWFCSSVDTWHKCSMHPPECNCCHPEYDGDFCIKDAEPADSEIDTIVTLSAEIKITCDCLYPDCCEDCIPF